MSFTQIDLERHSKNQSLTNEKIKDNSVTTSKIRIDNDLNFYGYRITNLGDPLNDYDVANKKYVDSLINGLSWKNPVDSIISYDNLPTNLSIADKGKRFLINSGAEINQIFEWDGYQWIRYQPQDNWSVFNKENDNAYVYDAQSNNDFKWILFTSLGGAIVYNGGVGIDISNNVISAKLGAGITSLPNGYIGIDIEPNTGLAFDSNPLLNVNAKLKIDSTKVVTTYSSATINSEITFSDSSTLNVNGDFVFKSKLIQDFVNFYSETIQVENSTNIINLNYTPLNSIDTQIFINGVLQISGYSIDIQNKRIIFEEAIPSGSVVKIFYFTNEGNAANGMIIGYLSGGGNGGTNLPSASDHQLLVYSNNNWVPTEGLYYDNIFRTLSVENLGIGGVSGGSIVFNGTISLRLSDVYFYNNYVPFLRIYNGELFFLNSIKIGSFNYPSEKLDIDGNILLNGELKSNSGVIRYNSNSNHWEFSNNGSQFYPFGASKNPIVVNISQPNNETDHSLKIIKIINNTGNVLEAGKLVFVNSDGNIQLASNTSENTIALGVVKDTVNNGEEAEIIIEGVLQIPENITINNRFIYLGENEAFIDTIPQGTGRVVQLIGEK
ncbi:MAG: hypothetical protein QXN52_09630 [Nitrososphaerota archaeon]